MSYSKILTIFFAVFLGICTLGHAQIDISSFSFESTTVVSPPAGTYQPVAYGFLGVDTNNIIIPEGSSFSALDNSLINDLITILQATETPRVKGRMLNYPNPFRLAETSKIGFDLSLNLEVEILVYNIRGHLVTRKPFSGVSDLVGYNKITVDQAFFDYQDVPAGVYFYFLVHEGVVLAKGKMAIVP